MARRLTTPRHGGIATTSDERGVVYVEFLFAFVPLFLLFLGICQLALLHTARLIVQHAAFAAARSAIVVLHESPDSYDGAERGHLSRGRADAHAGIDGMLARMGLLPVTGLLSNPSELSGGFVGFLASVISGTVKRQQGARMAPIRAAAYMPLIPLAPRASTPTLSASVDAGIVNDVSAALNYTKAASVITIQAGPGSPDLAADPIDANAAVTVRVTYVYECGVPIVRGLVCSSLESLLTQKAGVGLFGILFGPPPSKLAQRLQFGESSGLDQLLPRDASVVVFDAEATLPNQGVAHLGKDWDDAA